MRCACIALAASLLAGCITAPPVVILDQRTAMERQAAGRYPVLEEDMEQAALTPKAEDLASSQVAEDLTGSDDAGLVEIYGALHGDADRIDRLLVRRCVGEGRDGLLRETLDRCGARTEREVVERLVQRANRQRRQIWRRILSFSPGATEASVREAWRERHWRGVVCGAQIELPGGSWGTKSC